jgi:hypothetical protein
MFPAVSQFYLNQENTLFRHLYDALTGKITAQRLSEETGIPVEDAVDFIAEWNAYLMEEMKHENNLSLN